MPKVRKVLSEEVTTWKQPAYVSKHPRHLNKRATPEEIAAAQEALPDRSGISRIDQPGRRTHGWFARIHGSSPVAKMFSDYKHGGMQAALDAAVAWRDEERGNRQ